MVFLKTVGGTGRVCSRDTGGADGLDSKTQAQPRGLPNTKPRLGLEDRAPGSGERGAGFPATPPGAVPHSRASACHPAGGR